MMIGSVPYEFIARHYRKPLVIAGFEPLDILQSIWMVLKQLAEGRSEVENQYQRVVPDAGNDPALNAVHKVFQLRWFRQLLAHAATRRCVRSHGRSNPRMTKRRNLPYASHDRVDPSTRSHTSHQA